MHEIKTTLALDLGAKTGWAVAISTKHSSLPVDIKSGTFHRKRSSSEGSGVKYLSFKNWLLSLCRVWSYEIDQIYFEEVRRHLGTAAAHSYGGYLGILTAFAEEHGIPYLGVPVGTIKLHATGKGNASKTMMIDAMRDKGHSPCDDNEADALALLYYSLSKGVTSLEV